MLIVTDLPVIAGSVNLRHGDPHFSIRAGAASVKVILQ